MKIYGKPPLPNHQKDKRCHKKNQSNSKALESRRSLSLVDILQPTSNNAEPSQNLMTARKQSAPGILPCVQANAKLIHRPSVPSSKPRSATLFRNSHIHLQGSISGVGSGDHSSSNSTPTHQKSEKSSKETTSCSLETYNGGLSSSNFQIPNYMALKISENGEVLSLDPPPPSSLSGKLTHEDEILFTQSDELFRQVLTLCHGDGPDLDKRLRRECLPSNMLENQNRNDIDVTALNLSGQKLTSLPSISLFNSMVSTPNASAREHTNVTSPTSNLIKTVTLDSEKSLEEIDVNSSSQGQNSPSIPDYDYKKIFGILRMIEEEENKGSEIASCFGNFLREKYVDSPPPVQAGSGQCQTFHPTNTLMGSPPEVLKPSHPESVTSTSSHLLLPDYKSPGRPSSVSSTIRQSEQEGSEFYYSTNGITTPIPLCHSEGHGFDMLDGNEHPGIHQVDPRNMYLPSSSRSSHIFEQWETTDAQAKSLFSFLDEVEQCDRETLFNLKYDTEKNSGASPRPSSISTTQPTRSNVSMRVPARGTMMTKIVTQTNTTLNTARTMDTLIRKGSVELAREIIMLERQVEDSTYNVHVLEETLLSQRELNIRNMKNSEKDLKKRLKIQQEETELAVSRQQAFVDQLITEKRALQEKCEKILKESKGIEEKYQQQMKSLQEKHLEEIKRLKKIRENSEKCKKQKWVGQKTQELRDLTVKGLEPEVQRIIQRHQQEMSETRAFYTDELQEVEERYARKQTHQLQELRENFNREKDEACHRERDILQKRHAAEIQRQAENYEIQKRRLLTEIKEEKEHLAAEEVKVRDLAMENIRKVQIRSEVEVENARQEYDIKILNLEKRHENEIQSLRDNFESQREAWMINFRKKNEQILEDREIRLIETLNDEKEKEIRDREKKWKDESERVRKEEEVAAEARIKRLLEKFQSELQDFEKSEKELKQKFSTLKSEVINKEEEIFSLRTCLGLKEKENHDLNEANMKMIEERVNLTSIIRREFASQIEILEEDCRTVKSAVIELKTKHKFDLEASHLELEKLRNEKDIEIEKIGYRVKQALGRKEETMLEMTKQLEKSHIRVNHLEALLEQQRKDFVQSMTTSSSSSKRK